MPTSLQIRTLLSSKIEWHRVCEWNFVYTDVAQTYHYWPLVGVVRHIKFTVCHCIDCCWGQRVIILQHYDQPPPRGPLVLSSATACGQFVVADSNNSKLSGLTCQYSFFFYHLPTGTTNHIKYNFPQLKYKLGTDEKCTLIMWSAPEYTSDAIVDWKMWLQCAFPV
jgi:hypothetical protein